MYRFIAINLFDFKEKVELNSIKTNVNSTEKELASLLLAKEVNLSSLKMPKVKDLTSFFSLAQIDSLLLNDFNTENIAVMKTMFWGSEIDLVDLRSFNMKVHPPKIALQFLRSVFLLE